jgi:Toxin PAAR-like domain
VTVFVNGQSVVHRGSGGKVVTVSINLTGEEYVPIAYQNIAYSQDARNTASGFYCNADPICHQASYFSTSYGDEAGDKGGILSGTVNGIAEFVTAWPSCQLSSRMYLNHHPVVTAGDLMVSNHRNTPPAPLQQTCKAVASVPRRSQSYAPSDNTSPYFDIEFYCYSKQVFAWWAVTTTAEAFYPLSCYSKRQVHQLQQRIAKSEKDHEIALALLANNGELLSIPIARIAYPQLSEIVLRATEIDCLWQLPPVVDQTGTFAAILHYPETVRKLIYSQLLQPTQGEQWQLSLTPALRQLLEQYKGEAPSPRLPQGWLYVYMNGFLWREIEVDSRGEFAEVDLQQAGQDERVASGQRLNTLVVITEICGKATLLEFAFSTQQWSWTHINYYGGMQPHDSRDLSDAAPTSDHQSRFRRQQRFQAVTGERLQALARSPSPRIRRGNVAKPSLLLVPIVLVSHASGLLDRAVADLSTLLRQSLNALQSSADTTALGSALASVLQTLGSDVVSGQQKNRPNVYSHRKPYQRVVAGLQDTLVHYFKKVDGAIWAEYFSSRGTHYERGFLYFAQLLGLSCVTTAHLEYLIAASPSTQQAGSQLLTAMIADQHLTQLLFPSQENRGSIGAFNSNAFADLFDVPYCQSQHMYTLLSLFILCTTSIVATRERLCWQQRLTSWFSLIQRQTGLAIVLKQQLQPEGVAISMSAKATRKLWPYFHCSELDDYLPAKHLQQIQRCCLTINVATVLSLHPQVKLRALPIPLTAMTFPAEHDLTLALLTKVLWREQLRNLVFRLIQGDPGSCYLSPHSNVAQYLLTGDAKQSATRHLYAWPLSPPVFWFLHWCVHLITLCKRVLPTRGYQEMIAWVVQHSRDGAVLDKQILAKRLLQPQFLVSPETVRLRFPWYSDYTQHTLVFVGQSLLLKSSEDKAGVMEFCYQPGTTAKPAGLLKSRGLVEVQLDVRVPLKFKYRLTASL